ncbi:MAG: Gldg family protein, partial [Chitinophagaceae bacterium]
NGGPIRKTILLTTSRYSRIIPTPSRVSWEEVKVKPRIRDYQSKFLPIGVLLEGKFPSLFQNRLDQATLSKIDATFPHPFLNTGRENKMIVVSDGDLITNSFSKKDGPLPMGMNEYTRYLFANKEFFLNCLEYLTSSGGLLATRGKEFKLRMLDSGEVKRGRIKWQILNFVIPIGLILLFGMIFNFVRFRKYAE